MFLFICMLNSFIFQAFIQGDNQNQIKLWQSLHCHDYKLDSNEDHENMITKFHVCFSEKHEGRLGMKHKKTAIIFLK